MTKKIYRITLFENANGVCEHLAGMAARANGGSNYDLKQMKETGEMLAKEFPQMYPDMTFELIGDNLLHVDMRIGNNYYTVCSIQQVEVWEPETILEEE